MRIVTADETGLLKIIRVESGKTLAVRGEQDRTLGIRTLSWGCGGNVPDKLVDFSRLHVARYNGSVESWEVSSSPSGNMNEETCNLELRSSLDFPSRPVSLSCLPPLGTSVDQYHLVTCGADGVVQVCKTGDVAGHVDPVNFRIRGPVSAAFAQLTGKGANLVAGGKENDLTSWDLEKKQCVWKAKNVPHDFLDLRQPVWVTAVQPLSPNEGDSKLVTGTAHRQVRLYDTRVGGRRPTHSIDADEHGITTLTVNVDNQEVIAADTAGLVRALDLRQLKWGRRFAGPAGSVRSMALHSSLPVLACVGLDRIARVYDVRSAEELFHVYLKQRLNAVLFDEEGRVADKGVSTRGSIGEEAEDLSDEDEGWGSGEEYEMDEGSSEDDEEESDTVNTGKVRNSSGNHQGMGNVSSSVEEDSEEEEDDSGGGESEDEEDGEGLGNLERGNCNEGEEIPPSKRRRPLGSISKSKRKTR
ncbi:unnamed protein product [Discosporangium mesarthrocarpum]